MKTGMAFRQKMLPQFEFADTRLVPSQARSGAPEDVVSQAEQGSNSGYSHLDCVLCSFAAADTHLPPAILSRFMI